MYVWYTGSGPSPSALSQTTAEAVETVPVGSCKPAHTLRKFLWFLSLDHFWIILKTSLLVALSAFLQIFNPNLLPLLLTHTHLPVAPITFFKSLIHTFKFYGYIAYTCTSLKKNLNAPRPSELASPHMFTYITFKSIIDTTNKLRLLPLLITLSPL